MLLSVSLASAGDWPQWQGPNRDSISSDTKLLEVWPKEGPKLLWSITEESKVGTGYGTPVIVKNNLYILGGTGPKKDAEEFVTCLNVKDGSQVWQTKLKTAEGDFLDMWGGGPRGTPTVDGDFLYVLGAKGDLHCLSLEKGEVQWNKNLVKDFGGKIPQWGYSESVLVDGDNLICTPGTGTGMIALNKKTGETVWKCTDFKDGAGYSSIVISQVEGIKQYVQQTMSSAVGVRAKDGKLLWSDKSLARKIAVIPTPVLQDNYAFFTAGYGAGCECFKFEKDGEGIKATTVYTKNKVFANHHGGVVRLGDFLYGHSDNGGWLCFNMKAGGDEPVWKNQGVGKGSVSAAAGMLYCYSENDGTLALVKASEKKYEEISRFKIPQSSKLRPGQGKVWAHPVISNGKLYLRDYELLFVFDISGNS
jgi:hypothetical protein